MIPARYL